MKKAAKNKAPEEKSERANYRMELICERLTGIPYDRFVTREMQWGIDHEQDARDAYEIERGILVDTVGFVQHPEIPNFGCSPDGLVGERGMLQIKCPTTRTHLEWMLAGLMPEEHYPQALAELACNPDRMWYDFMSFDPRLPRHLQKFIVRLNRDDVCMRLIRGVEAEVEHFNAEIDHVLSALPQPQAIAELLDWPKNDEVEL